MKPTVKIALMLSVVVAAVVWINQQRGRDSGQNVTNLDPTAPQILGLRPAPTQAHPETLSNSQFTLGSNSASVPQTVRSILPGNGESFSARLTHVHNLGPHLSRSEIQALYSFLKTQYGPDLKSRGGEHVLKNDVLDALLNQVSLPRDLADMLIGLYQDHDQDAVTRDYALQHLVSCYERLINDPTMTRRGIESTLWQAISETDMSIGGTALLGLHRLSGLTAEIDAKELDKAALQLAKDDRASHLVRTTALQVCAERGISEIRQILLELAQSGTDVPLQISAIAALGRLGTQQEVALLEQLLLGETERLKPAARTALKRLRQRLQVIEPAI